MYKVFSSQYSFFYGEEIRFPYSIASLVSYVKKNKSIRENFHFEKTFLNPKDVEKHIENYEDIDILLCSCYVWNWEVTKHLASNIKKKNPNCKIIFGGPQVPKLPDVGFFQDNPFIDVVVRGEGEIVLNNLLEKYYKNSDEWELFIYKIKGISTKWFTNEREEFISNLDEIPSPYLNNVVWDLVDKDDNVKYITSWETNRGCPFKCIFCDWGSALNSKIRKFSNEKLFQEIKWFVDNNISYIDGCDSNFGILKRDIELAKEFKKYKNKWTGRFRPSWTKTTSDRVIEVAKELKEAGVLKAVTLALQSLDKTTLKNIKRKNLPFEQYRELTKKFKDNNIPTYTEIIVGLPGETLNSFKYGLETIISNTEIGTIYVYNCTFILNAPIVDEVDKFGIKTIKSPIYLTHSNFNKEKNNEYEYLVVGTYSYTVEDLKKMFLYSWMVQTYFSFGILDKIMKYCKQMYGISYMNFLDEFLKISQREEYKNNIFGKNYRYAKEYIDKGYSGNGWDCYDKKLGNIYWSLEEYTWIKTVDEQSLFNDILDMLVKMDSIFCKERENKILRELITFQLFLLTTKYKKQNIVKRKFNFDWKEFFKNKDNSLNKRKLFYSYKNKVIEKDDIRWNYEAIFWGRSKRKYKCLLKEIEEC